ncbi:O-Antigen ligase [Aquimixticola soesokkakensis]|uniref:O-Antigen ligase n=1 Tax=Aquimixticola soesokkakensis TaxID=1519096 RepID=A0A1Y5RBN7_9RHOB|nr:O-antigen ligase family protein [Aquimixticola soesokkakensis]SLN13539.1 O-Antigen ligase [Aquimixticola soesokkakensis]
MDFDKLKQKVSERALDRQDVSLNPPDSGLQFEEDIFEEKLSETARSRSSAARRITNSFSWLGPALVLLAPIPFGSNRPVLWMFWCVVLFLALAIFAGAVAARDPGRSIRVSSLRGLIAIGLCIPLAGLVQLVPLGILNSLPAHIPPDLVPRRMSLSASSSLMAALRILSYIALFVIVVATSLRPDRVKSRLHYIFYAVFAHAVLGLVMLTVLGDISILGPKESYEGFATGTFVNRNSFATFLGMGLVCGMALLMDRANRRRMRRPGKLSLLSPERIELLMFASALGIVFIAQVFTASRAATASTLVGLWVVYVLMSAKARGSILRPLLRGGGAIAVLTLVAFATFGSDLLDRSLTIDSAAGTRLDLYKQVIGMIAMRPLSGYGLDSFRIAYELFHELPVSTAFTWSLAHSTYLALWVELGLVAGTLPMIAVGMVFVRSFKSYLNRTTDFVAPVATLGAIVVAALHSTVDFSLEMEANVFLLIAICGLGVANLRPSRSTKVSPE